MEILYIKYFLYSKILIHQNFTFTHNAYQIYTIKKKRALPLTFDILRTVTPHEW